MSTFPFAFDPRHAWLATMTTGATESNSSVRLEGGLVVVEFGLLGMSTPLDNVDHVRITRDYRWFKAMGARLSLADRGATYGSNATGGVCIGFHEPVRALPVVSSPALTVTVADLEGFAAALRSAAGLPASGE